MSQPKRKEGLRKRLRGAARGKKKTKMDGWIDGRGGCFVIGELEPKEEKSRR